MDVMASPVTVVQLENKLKPLLRAYKNGKDNEGRTGASPGIIPYEKELDEIYGDKPLIACSHITSSTPTSSASSSHFSIPVVPVSNISVKNPTTYSSVTPKPASTSFKIKVIPVSSAIKLPIFTKNTTLPTTSLSSSNTSNLVQNDPIRISSITKTSTPTKPLHHPSSLPSNQSITGTASSSARITANPSSTSFGSPVTLPSSPISSVPSSSCTSNLVQNNPIRISSVTKTSTPTKPLHHPSSLPSNQSITGTASSSERITANPSSTSFGSPVTLPSSPISSIPSSSCTSSNSANLSQNSNASATEPTTRKRKTQRANKNSDKILKLFEKKKELLLFLNEERNKRNKELVEAIRNSKNNQN